MLPAAFNQRIYSVAWQGASKNISALLFTLLVWCRSWEAWYHYHQIASTLQAAPIFEHPQVIICFVSPEALLQIVWVLAHDNYIPWKMPSQTEGRIKWEISLELFLRSRTVLCTQAPWNLIYLASSLARFLYYRQNIIKYLVWTVQV